jgi:hypothetical protein
LATSALIASRDNLLSIQPKEACNAILDGYQAALEKGGAAFVLAESHDHLRKMALPQLRDPIRFWQKLDALAPLNQAPPELVDLLSSAFPEPCLHITIIHRIAGLGSLGRERYTAIANFHDGKAAREAKRLAVSACAWAKGCEPTGEIFYQQIIDQAVHSSDPFTKQNESWVVRRIAPDCSRIELADLPRERDEVRLLSAMGWETANVHLGAGAGIKEQIVDDLAKRPAGWLLQASQEMMKSVLQDWQV